MSNRPVVPAFVLLVAACGAALSSAPAAAAPSYDGCVGFIDVLPAVVSTQGTWCLRQDLATAIATGDAILVATNNVTIDCNGFKLGGLAAGPTSQARGIGAAGRRNVTVRGCTVRGFNTGIDLTGAGNQGSLVEDNRVDYSLFAGIRVEGTSEGGSVVRRNQVIATGGETTSSYVYGIVARADVIDNTVESVLQVKAGGHAIGIQSYGYGFEIRENRVRDVMPGSGGSATGIYFFGAGTRAKDNHVTNAQLTTGTGIRADDPDVFCMDNSVLGFQTAYNGCGFASGNLPEMP